MQRSRCGLDCGSCPNREEFSCSGCTELEEGNWAGNCEIKKCCEEKQLSHCGLCPEFPCDILRNTAFDPDEGDDGERLVTLKHWAEEVPSERDTRVERILIGVLAGAVVGAALGAFSGSFVPVMTACILTGAAIGIILNIFKGDRQ